MEIQVGDRRVEISGHARLTCTLIHYDSEGSADSLVLHDNLTVWFLDARGREHGEPPCGVYWVNSCDPVFCKFCKGPENLKMAHLHDGMYVCEKCWSDAPQSRTARTARVAATRARAACEAAYAAVAVFADANAASAAQAAADAADEAAYAAYRIAALAGGQGELGERPRR